MLCAAVVYQNGKLERMALQICSNYMESEVDICILTLDISGSIAAWLQQKN